MSGNKQRRFTNEFKREAVPMTSGPSVERVANDLGIAKSTLSRLRSEHEQADLLEGPHEDASKELARLRKENGILRPEREILKKAAFRSISRKGAPDRRAGEDHSGRMMDFRSWLEKIGLCSDRETILCETKEVCHACDLARSPFC